MAVVPNNVFTGYNRDKLKDMAKSYGYSGEDLADFGSFLEQNPDMAARYFLNRTLTCLVHMRNKASFKQVGYSHL